MIYCNKSRYLIVWAFGFIVLSGTNASAQSYDFYSQTVIKSLINPAFTGNSAFDWNIYNLFSSKRILVDNPRNSILLGGNYQWTFFPDKLNVGGFVSKTSYTGLPFSNYEAVASISYEKRFINQSVYLGIQPGYVHFQLDKDQLLFPDQYDYETGLFNSIQTTGEPLEITDYSNFDLASGIGYRKEFRNFIAQSGFSMYHITRPVISYGLEEIRHPITSIFFITAGYFFSPNYGIEPAYFFKANGYFVSNKAGATLLYHLNRFSLPVKSISAGLFYDLRNQHYPDLIQTQLGMQLYKFRLILNYDFSMSVTQSSLKNYRVIEFGLIFNGFNSMPINYIKPCDVF